MNKLIEDNYKSIFKRGLIDSKTTKKEFICKLEEELQEFIDAALYNHGNEKEELADVILVCLNISKHYDIDIEKELKNKILINEKR